jgi:hypothetical protein
MRIASLFPRLGVPFGMAVGGIFAVTFTVTLLTLAIGRAEAHGIAGNRFFVGTLTFDDPAVNDELSSTFSALRRNAPGGTAVERQLTTETSRLLTPSLAIGAETSWIDRGGHSPSGASGVDGLRLNLKGLVFRDDPREMLLSAGLTWGLPGVGRRQLEAHGTIEPAVFFRQGFRRSPRRARRLAPIRDYRRARLGASHRQRTRERIAALGRVAAVQHAVSDRPLHRPAAGRRAAVSMAAAG